jgi:signal transduction histidine kinase
MPSSTPPTPSAAAASDLSRIARLRRRAGELLAAHSAFGLVWLDQDLNVHTRFGTLVEFVALGEPVTHSLAPLIGLEADIKRLKAGQVLRVPSVSIVTDSGPGPRINLVFYAFDSEELTLMVVAPAQLDTALTLELSRQIRGRLMAETEAAAKSQELARTNAELMIANSNLEQFATIATHDLKAPMRALGYLADEIESAMSASDGDRAKRKLAELRSQASRVSSMLSALLHYSSAGRSNASIESVDVRELIDEIVRSLPRGTVAVTLLGDWPRLDTLAAPLGLALRNLIDNTIKHHDRRDGRLLISCADAGEAFEITLADDGPGIAPEHHASMFLPFRTLGTGGEGMGLAIVQKMLDAVGGTIALQSDPGHKRGATFIIRWPKQIAL